MPGRLNRRWSKSLALLAAALVWGLAAESARAAAAPADLSAVALQVSFEPAASVRLRGDRFAGSTGADVAAVNAVLRSLPGARVERLFEASEASIDARRERLTDHGKRDVPDLNRHYRIVARDRSERDRLLTALGRLSRSPRSSPSPRLRRRPPRRTSSARSATATRPPSASTPRRSPHVRAGPEIA